MAAHRVFHASEAWARQEPKDLTDKDVQEHADKLAVRRTASIPFEQQVGFFAQNGLQNPNWEATMSAAFCNLNTIGVHSNGKPRGQLNDAGREGLELFKRLDRYGDYLFACQDHHGFAGTDRREMLKAITTGFPSCVGAQRFRVEFSII